MTVSCDDDPDESSPKLCATSACQPKPLVATKIKGRDTNAKRQRRCRILLSDDEDDYDDDSLRERLSVVIRLPDSSVVPELLLLKQA